jgi:type II restriction enzyme
MSKKDELRNQRSGTVINQISSKQEKELAIAIERVREALPKKFPGISLEFERQWLLRDVVISLKENFPEVDFTYCHETSSMRPDGGILSIRRNDGKTFPVLIAEKKNQGTNDIRAIEGKPKQAKGNAIERLGKNVIGFRAALLNESIFPFVCFGDGCDFDDGSSIIDRVVTIAMFGKLNHEYLHVQDGKFNRGSFYFRVEQWTSDEMFEISLEIVIKSVFYYYSKYGEENFN